MGADRDSFLMVHPQAGSRMRLYAAHGPAANERYNGPEGAERFLATFRRDWLPEGGEALAGATPCGESAVVTVNDSWVERPYGEGVVLIGDAAGWSDPRLGQGIAVALRDVACWSTSSAAATTGPTWPATAFPATARNGMSACAASGWRPRSPPSSTATTRRAAAGGVRRIRVMVDALAGRIDPRFACSASLIGPWELPADGFTPEAVAAVEALAEP